ncbi:hypothetical protein PIB30_106872 [Stylosanthes scabra]|uniref:HTH myb-type domain-containing protein n=1 Tax=Stylosanthes scabra TaxID=79078 RepID=A0ABU6R026_9FABA|nr:hypothetical protein [Stylosanthes scabra]
MGLGGWGVMVEHQVGGGWKKGLWTSEEDRLLIEYVKICGEGLKRNGKSCILIWVNYLRPDLKRGQKPPLEAAAFQQQQQLKLQQQLQQQQQIQQEEQIQFNLGMRGIMMNLLEMENHNNDHRVPSMSQDIAAAAATTTTTANSMYQQQSSTEEEHGFFYYPMIINNNGSNNENNYSPAETTESASSEEIL